jgi:hypothetical protein
MGRRTLLNPVIKWRNADGEVTRVVTAREGELRVDGDTGELEILVRWATTNMDNCHMSDYIERIFTVPLPAFAQKQ